MHAIVRQGGGKYYASAVFGYYHDVKAEEIDENYCWFRAQHMKYHIIPD